MIGGKSVSEWSFIHPKKHVFGWNFLMKPAPYLFSGPIWCVRRQNCSRWKLYSILPRKPSGNRFSKKHVFGFNFRTKSRLTYFLGQTDGMAWLGAKVSRSEVLSILKNTFSDGIFLWTRPRTSFLGLVGYMVRSGAKLFRTKIVLNFASKALSNSFFQKRRFRLEFLY